MAENDQFLFERVVRSKYAFSEGDDVFTHTEGIRIYAMNHRFPYEADKIAVRHINWEGFFSPDCRPIVNVTVGRMDRNRLWISVRGPGEENWPNSRGCEIHGVMDPDAPYTFERIMPIHIMAIGY